MKETLTLGMESTMNTIEESYGRELDAKIATREVQEQSVELMKRDGEEGRAMRCFIAVQSLSALVSLKDAGHQRKHGRQSKYATGPGALADMAKSLQDAQDASSRAKSAQQSMYVATQKLGDD